MNDTTPFEQRFEERLRSFAKTGVQAVDSAAVARAVAVDHPRNASTRPARRAKLGRWGTRPMSRTSIAAAVVIAVVVVGGAFFVTQRGLPPIGGPGPSANASLIPSQPAVVVPSATPTSEVSPSPDPTSLKLTWTEFVLDERSPLVAWLGDRFVLVDQDTGAVRASSDGQTWQALQPGDDPGYSELLRPRRGHLTGAYVSWEDDIVGWWNPEERPSIPNQPPVTARDILRIIRPPAPPIDTTPFKGRVESIGIGPKGIVAQVHSHLDWDAWVASKLGDDWVSHYTGVDFNDGILTIGMDDGPGLEVVWADEGFEPGDYQDAGFGWYSPDGEQWTAMPFVGTPGVDGYRGFATGFGDVVGVSDGFIVRGASPEEESCPLPDGCGDMWHSADGLTWRNLGLPEADSSADGSVLVPWKGGALLTDGVGRFDFWTSQGSSELPMAAELPAAWKQAEGNAEEFSLGPLGLVTARRDYAQILFTRDGVAWDIQAMPAEMEADWTVGLGIAGPSVVVGDRGVLVVLSSGTEEAPIRTLWVGSVEP